MNEDKGKSADELATLFPASETVTVGGVAVTVEPLTIVQLGRVAKVLKGVVDSATGLDWPTLCAEHTERAVEAVSAATGKPTDFIGGLRADEFLVLAMAVVRVNADFFAKRLVPLAAEATALATRILGAGQMPSATLSGAAT